MPKNYIMNKLLGKNLQGGVVGLALAQLCVNPTACDSNFSSCTIGAGCLGSPITMCAIGLGGNGTSDSACPAFTDGTHYCSCKNCVGLINSVDFTLK